MQEVMDRLCQMQLDITPGPVELLVVQPTPYCNLACSYCYLPDRSARERMRRETLDAIGRRVIASPFTGRFLTVSWHAGEPLTVPAGWYEEAFALLESYAGTRVVLAHTIQTNCVLLNEAWLDLFERHSVFPGLSLDGPRALHDRYRVNRRGRGSFDAALRGLRMVRERGLPFAVIAVLTPEALDDPDGLLDFFLDEGVTDLRLNLEEIEGVHDTSRTLDVDMEPRFRRFLERLWQRVLEAPQFTNRERFGSNDRSVSCGSRAEKAT